MVRVLGKRCRTLCERKALKQSLPLGSLQSMEDNPYGSCTRQFDVRRPEPRRRSPSPNSHFHRLLTFPHDAVLAGCPSPFFPTTTSSRSLLPTKGINQVSLVNSYIPSRPYQLPPLSLLVVVSYSHPSIVASLPLCNIHPYTISYSIV